MLAAAEKFAQNRARGHRLALACPRGCVCGEPPAHQGSFAKFSCLRLLKSKDFYLSDPYLGEAYPGANSRVCLLLGSTAISDIYRYRL